MDRKEVPCSIPRCRSAAFYKIAAQWTDGCRQELTTYELPCVEHFALAFREAERRRHLHPSTSTEKMGELGIYRLSPSQGDAPPLRLRGLEAACRSWEQARQRKLPPMATAPAAAQTQAPAARAAAPVSSGSGRS
jgi:hypothetical protein